MDNSVIFRLEPNGPSSTGLAKLKLDPKDFQSDLPNQYWYIYFEDSRLGLTVGVWTTTPMQEAFGPYPGDEFMIVLEGQVELLDGKGRQTLVQQGETFVVSNGLPISWKQRGFCRKFFMTYQPQNITPVQSNSAAQKISILKTSALEPLLATPNSRHQNMITDKTSGLREAVCCINEAGNMVSGFQQSEAFETTVGPVGRHELVQLLTGNVQITEASGCVHDFAAGDVFFIPAGTRCGWIATEPTRHFFCRVDPAVSKVSPN